MTERKVWLLDDPEAGRVVYEDAAHARRDIATKRSTATLSGPFPFVSTSHHSCPCLQCCNARTVPRTADAQRTGVQWWPTDRGHVTITVAEYEHLKALDRERAFPMEESCASDATGPVVPKAPVKIAEPKRSPVVRAASPAASATPNAHDGSGPEGSGGASLSGPTSANAGDKAGVELLVGTVPGVESLTAEQARAQGYRAPASPVTLYIAPAGAADPRRYWYQSEAPEGEVAALRDLAKAVRAFVDSDDQDRIAEFDAMAAALACVGKEP